MKKKKSPKNKPAKDKPAGTPRPDLAVGLKYGKAAGRMYRIIRGLCTWAETASYGNSTQDADEFLVTEFEHFYCLVAEKVKISRDDWAAMKMPPKDMQHCKMLYDYYVGELQRGTRYKIECPRFPADVKGPDLYAESEWNGEPAEGEPPALVDQEILGIIYDLSEQWSCVNFHGLDRTPRDAMKWLVSFGWIEYRLSCSLHMEGFSETVETTLLVSGEYRAKMNKAIRDMRPAAWRNVTQTSGVEPLLKIQSECEVRLSTAGAQIRYNLEHSGPYRTGGMGKLGRVPGSVGIESVEVVRQEAAPGAPPAAPAEDTPAPAKAKAGPEGVGGADVGDGLGDQGEAPSGGPDVVLCRPRRQDKSWRIITHLITKKEWYKIPDGTKETWERQLKTVKDWLRGQIKQSRKTLREDGQTKTPEERTDLEGHIQACKLIFERIDIDGRWIRLPNSDGRIVIKP